MRAGQVRRLRPGGLRRAGARLAGLRLAGVLTAAALVVTGAVTLAPTLAPAAPLDEQTCAQLKREVGDLEGIGARNNMAKGPAWAKSNLSAAQIEQIKKLIEIEEAVMFRCSRPKPVVAQQPAPGKAKVKVPVKTVAKAPAADGTQAAAAAPAVAKPKPKPKPVAAQPGTGEAAAAPPPKPRPKPPAPPRQGAVAPGN